MTNAAQAISIYVDYTFCVYFNTCNSSSCWYSFSGSWSLHYINVWMLSLTWRWKRSTSSILKPELPLPHLLVVNSLTIDCYRQKSLSLCFLLKAYGNTHNVAMQFNTDHVFCCVIWFIVADSFTSLCKLGSLCVHVLLQFMITVARG